MTKASLLFIIILFKLYRINNRPKSSKLKYRHVQLRNSPMNEQDELICFKIVFLFQIQKKFFFFGF
jgi:hypothetical protein